MAKRTIIDFNSCDAGKGHPYFISNTEAMQNAMEDLSPSTFKVYVYFMTYKNMKTGFYFNIAAVTKKTKLSKNSVYTAMRDLKFKKYLTQNPELSEPNCMIFNEKPLP